MACFDRLLLFLTFGCFLSIVVDVHAIMSDGEQLAQRFRPYYKFSVDAGREPFPPCSWQWFVEHCALYRGATLLASTAELNPTNLLSYPDADIRSTHDPVGLLNLRATQEIRSGVGWDSVINEGAGLYAQCEDAGDGFVVITYWTLFAYNRTTVIGSHEGDIIAVTVIYDRKRDQLVRAVFGMHGDVVESLDLVSPNSEQYVDLKGRDVENRQVSVRAKLIQSPRHYYAGQWYSPSRPEIFLIEDPTSKLWDHLAVFCEWGTHEPWPNPSGLFPAAPKHGGDDVSFLPVRVRYLGSFANPTAVEAPFVFFNGIWGNDPKGIIFHRSCFYPESRSKNHFKIPENKFVDRDPFGAGPKLGWPPRR